MEWHGKKSHEYILNKQSTNNPHYKYDFNFIRIEILSCDSSLKFSFMVFYKSTLNFLIIGPLLFLIFWGKTFCQQLNASTWRRKFLDPSNEWSFKKGKITLKRYILDINFRLEWFWERREELSTISCNYYITLVNACWQFLAWKKVADTKRAITVLKIQQI